MAHVYTNYKPASSLGNRQITKRKIVALAVRVMLGICGLILPEQAGHGTV
jgi:hypothetical protein